MTVAEKVRVEVEVENQMIMAQSKIQGETIRNRTYKKEGYCLLSDRDWLFKDIKHIFIVQSANQGIVVNRESEKMIDFEVTVNEKEGSIIFKATIEHKMYSWDTEKIQTTWITEYTNFVPFSTIMYELKERAEQFYQEDKISFR